MKLKAGDNLKLVRAQMADFVETGSSVIEFGCGKGDLLLELSSKITSGLGIDQSNISIDSAIKQKERKNISNINFLCRELGSNYKPSGIYDFSIASLFFHVIPRSLSVDLLKQMRKISNNMLICAFSQPKSLQQKALLWFDQRFSNHYAHFKSYQKHGYMDGLLSEMHYKSIAVYNTHIPFVNIYKIHLG